MPSLQAQEHGNYGLLTTAQIAALSGMTEGDKAYDSTLGVPFQYVDAAWAAPGWKSVWHLPDDVSLELGEGGASSDFGMNWVSASNRVDVNTGGAGLMRWWVGDVQLLNDIGLCWGTDVDWKAEFVSASNKMTYTALAQAGISFLIEWDVPISAGGAAAAALDYKFMLDGALEAGLLAETDGAGSYRQPVWKVPYQAGDFGADWSGFTPPTPASLVNGSEMVAYNSNAGVLASRKYIYSNNNWGYIDFTSG
jgi:hypothetical protein